MDDKSQSQISKRCAFWSVLDRGLRGNIKSKCHKSYFGPLIALDTPHPL